MTARFPQKKLKKVGQKFVDRNVIVVSLQRDSEGAVFTITESEWHQRSK